MTLVAWHDSYRLGIDTFDEHHQHLVTLLNATYDAVKLNNRFTVETILAQLRNYAAYHFAAEEARMRETAFPGRDGHLQEHDHFTRQVDDFTAAILIEEPLHKIAIVAFLRQWLLDHILKADREFSEFLISCHR